MPAPTLVIFDVNETLSNMEPLRERFAEAGAPGQLLDVWFVSTLREGFALAAAGSYADFRTIALTVLREQLEQVETLRVPPQEAATEILGAFGQLDVHPDVPDGMRRLAGGEVRLATLTNGSAGNAQQLLQRAGLADLVERNFSVDEVRRWKPAAEPYLHAARESGLRPEACTLVASHPWDVHGAKRAGLVGAWLNRRGGDYPEFFEPPDAAAETLDGLAEALLAADD